MDSAPQGALGVATHKAHLSEELFTRGVRLCDAHLAPAAAADEAPSEGVVEALGEGGGGAILREGPPANDGEMGEGLDDFIAERLATLVRVWVEGVAGIEEDALEARHEGQQADKLLRRREGDRAVFQFKREAAGAVSCLEAVARKGDDAGGCLAGHGEEIVWEARCGPHLPHAAWNVLLEGGHLSHEL